MKRFSFFIFLLFASFTAINAANFEAPEEICASCPKTDNLAATNQTGTTADLSWAAVPDAASYTVVVENGKNNPIQFLFQTSTTATTTTVTGLTVGKNYKFKVRVHCTDGKKSGWAKWFDFNSSTSAPCTTPINLTATPTGPGSADLGWSAIGGAESYIVKVENGSGNPNQYLLLDTVPTNALSLSGLVPAKNYKFKVRSLCFGGNLTAWSPWFVFTTPAAKPSDFIQISERNSISDFEIQVAPNPISDRQANLKISGAKDKLVKIQLFDLAGREILTENAQPESEVWAQNLNLPEMKSGIYFLKVQFENSSRTLRILVNE